MDKEQHEGRQHYKRETIVKAQHTPGPWAFSKLTSHGYVVYAGNAGTNTGIALTTENYSSKRNATNARLIAAAPELLASLQRIVNGIPEEVIDTHIRNLLDGAEAAITKAVGAPPGETP